MNLVWGKVNLLLHINPGAQHSNHENDSGLRMGPRRQDLPFTQPLGTWRTDTELFPLSLFSLPMSSVWTKPGGALLPSGPKAFAGRRQNSQSPWLYKVEAGSQCAPAPWGRQTQGTPPFFLQSCLVNTSPLQINSLRRCPADLCLVPAFTSIVLVVGDVFLEAREIGLL